MTIATDQSANYNSNPFNSQTGGVSTCYFDKLTDKLILQIFSYLEKKYLLLIASVCKKWEQWVRNPALWQDVSFRTETGGIELHDFTELNTFPSRLIYLCIYLSDVIFMEGFMRKIYSYLTTIEIFHLIGTYEKLDNREEEESYEVINIHKIKSHTPNLRVVNFYGIKFLEDMHVELLSTNCVHLECLCLDFCTKFKGSSLKILIQRCKKLKCLLLEKTGITDEYVRAVSWENTAIQELDISLTEISGKTVALLLLKLKHLKYFAASNIQRLKDDAMGPLVETFDFQRIKTLNLSWCQNLGEPLLVKLIKRCGPNLTGLDLSGMYDLLEAFWTSVLPLLRNCRILIIGIPNECCQKIHSKVHIDQYIELIAQNCSDIEELEIQWDSDIMRFSEKSSKFIDHLRTKCSKLKSFVLAEGEYYEMVKSNFERADRYHIVSSRSNCVTSVLPLLTHYRKLCFT
ncbi:unnamed protein product [Gordionus sp. m RMFG-2023]|uniref:F-box/LRR-repeat protein 7-like isoform X2 n=1 Tax=Gordionus sp. m RMFG-2023 TaxID=3053472 RepID=UPI0030E5EB0C